MSEALALAVNGHRFDTALLIFDLDGTLVDSVPDIAAAVDATAIAADLPPPGEAQVRQWVGSGARRLVRRMLEHGHGRPVTDGELAEAHELFLAAYAARLVKDSRLYPGAEDLLQTLGKHDIPIACVTNKPEDLARGVLAGMGIENRFHWLLGGDSLEERKPSARPLAWVMQQAGVPATQALLVGDSETDVAAARNAGCSIVAARYGYNRGFVSESDQPDAWFDALSEIRILES